MKSLTIIAILFAVTLNFGSVSQNNIDPKKAVLDNTALKLEVKEGKKETAMLLDSLKKLKPVKKKSQTVNAVPCDTVYITQKKKPLFQRLFKNKKQ